MNAETRIVVGFITIGLSALFGWWFSNHYYRIGPEATEGLVVLAGVVAILVGSAKGFVLLVRGIKGLRVTQEP